MLTKCRAAALLLIPPTWHARRTRLYSSTEYISPPSARLPQASGCGILLRDGQIIRPIPWVFCLRDSHRCFLSRDLSSSNIWLTGGMNGSGFGRAGGPFLRYPGGTACFRIFDTVLRSIPKCRAAALLLIPPTWHARRTRLYSSTEYISPPSARLPQASGCGILLRDGQIIRPIPWVFCLRDSQPKPKKLGNRNVIPTVIDQNPCAHLRMPRDMIFHGWSMRLFQAWQHSATMSS